MISKKVEVQLQIHKLEPGQKYLKVKAALRFTGLKKTMEENIS